MLVKLEIIAVYSLSVCHADFSQEKITPANTRLGGKMGTLNAPHAVVTSSSYIRKGSAIFSDEYSYMGYEIKGRS